MAELSLWSGVCRVLHGSETSETIVSAWAGGEEDFVTRVRLSLSETGHQMLDFVRLSALDESDPQCLALTDPAAIAIGQQPAEHAPTIYRTFRTVEDATPLDPQFGVDPKKSIPDFLRDLAIRSPDDTSASDRRLYAILDAAKLSNLPELLQSSGLKHRCFFQGKAFDELKDVAPWIVQLDDDNAFTRHLFSHDTAKDVPWFLWEKQPGILVRSAAGLDDLWSHFRKFTRVQDNRGRWFFFRFWEQDHARHLLSSGSAETAAHLLKHGQIIVPNLMRQNITVFGAFSTGGSGAAPSKFVLSDPDITALRNASAERFVNKTTSWLRETYGPLTSTPDDVMFIRDQVLYAGQVLNLRNEQAIADYAAASWLLGRPAHERFDLTGLSNRQAKTMMRNAHTQAYEDTQRMLTT